MYFDFLKARFRSRLVVSLTCTRQTGLTDNLKLINLLEINGQSLVISCQSSVTVMEHDSTNISHWMRGQKIHKFILNGLQFSESFQKHTVIWIFFQLVLTRQEKKERNVKTAITLCLNALCVLCSTNISAHIYCIYVLRFWPRDHSYVINL